MFDARAAAAPCAPVKSLQPAAGPRVHVFKPGCGFGLALAGDEFAAIDIHDDIARWQDAPLLKIATERRVDRFASACFVGQFRRAIFQLTHKIPLVGCHNTLDVRSRVSPSALDNFCTR